MKPTPIILDVDAGVDDTLAIVAALRSPRINVCAITTVAGNVPVPLCTRNVLLTLEILAPQLKSIPIVAQGALGPGKRPLFTAKEVHGNDGIGGASAFYPSPLLKAEKQLAANIILDTLKQEKKITIVATGPLTNIALAIKKDPSVMKRAKEIVVMGGAFGGAHNTGPVAEFNFYVDPESADAVMNSGIPIRLVPLNVTEQCFLYPGDLRSIRDARLRRYLHRVTDFYFNFHRRTEGFLGGYLHDPLAVVAAVEPSLVKTETGYVHVETAGNYTRGASVFFPRLNVKKSAELPDWVKRDLVRKPGVHVATDVRADAFKRMFMKMISGR